MSREMSRRKGVDLKVISLMPFNPDDVILGVAIVMALNFCLVGSCFLTIFL
jgi:hypothetical protein